MVLQELIDAILSDVDEDDDLQACALVSRRFLLPAQQRLFKEMSFPRASNILSSFSHFLAFVRELKVGNRVLLAGRPLHTIPMDVCVVLVETFAQSSLQKVVLWSWDDYVPPSPLTTALASCQNVVVRCSTLEMAKAMDAASAVSEQGTNTYLSPAFDAGDGATPLECLAMHIRYSAGAFLLQPAISRLIRGLQRLEIHEDALPAAHFCSTMLTHLTLHMEWGLESAEFSRVGALRVLTLKSSTTSAWAIPMELVAPSLPMSLPRLEVLNIETQSGQDRGMPQAPALDAVLTGLAFLWTVNLTIYSAASAMEGGVELMDY
ncbi:hypothetical protein K438DRAFT_1959162 [Mycena galopus ATCC 62051]|nr:hypothetical protein K438DRAFT_1959162 [Mycena galopus ATCC 62051]